MAGTASDNTSEGPYVTPSDLPAPPNQLEGTGPSPIRPGEFGLDSSTWLGCSHPHRDGPGDAIEVDDTDRSAAQTMV